MYSLFYLGKQVEAKIGSVNFTMIYVITGLFAGISSVNVNLFVVSVGASGAIFGIYGFLIVHSLRNNPRIRFSIIANFIVYVGIVSLVGSQLHFDNAAHIGGAIAGLLLGLAYGNLPHLLINVGGLALILATFLVSPRDQVAYFNAYQKFISTDLRINKIMNARLSDIDFYDSLSNVKDLPHETLKDFRDLEHIPFKIQRDTSLIAEYLTLKSLQIQYFLRGLSQESFIYLDSIGTVGFQISRLPRVTYNLNFEIEDDANTNQNTPEELFTMRQDYDSGWFEIDNGEYEYYRIGQKDSLGNWHGRVEDYYKDGSVQMKGSYHRGLRDGIFIYYQADSTYDAAGRFNSDDRIGKWEMYQQNNQLFTEIRYEDGFAYVENLWDSTGRQLVADRNGEELYKYPNGIVRYKRNIVDGLNHGFIESYYENGDLRFKEYHEKGELIRGFSYFDKSENTYDASVYVPYPEGGYESFYNYIEEENILKSDSIEEVVIIRFDVHHTGRIHNLRFLKRYEEEYNQYAKELLMEGPDWVPAKSHGLFDISSIAEVTFRF